MKRIPARLQRFLHWWRKQLDPDVLHDQRKFNILLEAQLRKEIEAILGPIEEEEHHAH